MRVELTLPRRVENALEPATVFRIYHGASEPVCADEPVLELINADGMFDLKAPVTGMIVEVTVTPGEKVYPGGTLLVLESGSDE